MKQIRFLWAVGFAAAVAPILADGTAGIEDRLNRLEQKVDAAKPGSTSSNMNAMNPALSFILSGNYVNRTTSPNGSGTWLQGFQPSGIETPSRGFSLGESEFAASANIDPYLSGTFILSVPSDNKDNPTVEEAYIQTLGLGYGLTLKAGRFYSGVGYLNEHHAHTWDFNDTPLPYDAFLGGQLAQDGVQLRWIAPLPLFLEFGGELSRGQNFPGNDKDKNGAGIGALFVHVGGDISPTWSWTSGASWLAASPENRTFADPIEQTQRSFSGKTRTWILDAVFKHDSTSEIQAEYFQGSENGHLLIDAANNGSSTDYRSSPRGGYIQGILGFFPLSRFRGGARYEFANGRGSDGDAVSSLSPYTVTGWALMAEFNPSEFSRFRLQYGQRRVGNDTNHDARKIKQLWLQYVVSLGAHGAHKY